MTERKCSSLKENEIVVFNVWNDIYREKRPIDGNVISVDLERRVVWCCWLEGYKDYRKPIPFEDMLAVYNPNGGIMKFENISGKSDLLVAE